MSVNLQAVRGMNDILPPVSAQWRELERCLTDILAGYGYGEIRMPMVEQSAVFKRSIGDATDIVQKEMYTFDDRNGDSLTLRPEGTAGCVRAVLEHGVLQHLPQRLWYLGPMFRHERPQRGRHRQFHQLGVEVFGATGPDIDAEVILICARMWRALGLGNLRLELNSLGSNDARAAYRTALHAYFSSHAGILDADSRDRLERNPLRILDSKNPAMAELIAGAPALAGFLDDESRAHFDGLCERLADNGVAFALNPRLVRGLDYYCKTVFEWVTTELGAQGTVCAGGRYDGLVELMGGRPTPAVGFAMGLERLLELCAANLGSSALLSRGVYVCTATDTLEPAALRLAEDLRSQCPGLIVINHAGGGRLKAQLKKADRSGAQIAVILGEEEALRGEVAVKPLRDGREQQVCRVADLPSLIATLAGTR